MKNKTLLKILCLAAVLCMFFAACAGDTGSKSDAPDGGTAAEAEVTEAVTEPEYKRPDVDYNGREFIFSAWATDSPNWVATSYCEITSEEQNGDIINDAIYDRRLAVEESFGITIVPRKYKSGGEMVNSTMAGDHYADTVLLDGGAIPKVVSGQLCLDLFTIETLDLTKSWWNQTATDQLTIGGKLFFAPGNIGSFDALSVFTTYVNKNMVESFNLSNPYDEVRSGTWTVDVMEEHAKTVAADLNGDGVMDDKDRFGMSSEALTSVVLRSCGVTLTEKDSDDYPVYSLVGSAGNTARAASVIEKIVPLWRDKATTLYTGDFSSKYSHVFSQFLVPQFIADKLLYLNNWMSVAFEMRKMDSDFGILPPPKFDESQESYYVPASESWTAYAVVPITVTDTDYTGHIMDALGYYGKEYIHTALIDKTITNKTIRDTDTEEMLEIIYANRTFDIAALYDWGGLNGILSGFISGNSTDFMSKMAASEEKIVAAIATTIEELQ